MKQITEKIILGTIITEIVLACIFILIGKITSESWNILASVGIIFLYSIPCLAYSKIYDYKKYNYVSICGAVVAFFSALMLILKLWNIISFSVLILKVFRILNVIMWMLIFIVELLAIISTNNLLNLFKKITISLISLLTFIIILNIWLGFISSGIILRLFCVLILLTGGSFICTLILTKISPKEIQEISQLRKTHNNTLVKNDFVEQSNIQEKENNQIQNQTIVSSKIITNTTGTPNSLIDSQSDLLKENGKSNNNDKLNVN